MYPCGTPRTKHIITNVRAAVDEDLGTATCCSYYTVLQATTGFPLQIVAAGRYYDELKRENGRWHFTFRDYSMLDLVGDMRFHHRTASEPASKRDCG